MTARSDSIDPKSKIQNLNLFRDESLDSIVLPQKEPSKELLDDLYKKYNHKTYIQYDPIKFLYRFQEEQEIELVGLIVSSFSFGRVTQIFKAVESLLELLNNEPLQYVLSLKKRPDKKLLSFRYRFVSGQDVFNLLWSAKRMMLEYGSLGAFAEKNYEKGGFLELADKTIKAFDDVRFLIPSSLKNSACKRLFMFFRWMVRDDNIDLGLWKFINPQELVIPVDTHILKVSRALGFTSRKNASLGTALEITHRLKNYSEQDPIKYDWALSHMGIIRNNFAV